MDPRAVKALAQAVAPIVRDAIAEHVKPLLERLGAIEARPPEKGEKGDPGTDGRNGVDAVQFSLDELAAAVVGHPSLAGRDGKDGRDGQPGIAGRDGKDGAPGRDGIDGNDGLGFDDMEPFEDERTFGVTFRRGDQVKEMRWQKSSIVDWHRDVWRPGEYKRGEIVTWDGSQFMAKADTITKPQTSPDWRLIVKRGQNGKDGVIKPIEQKLVALK